MTELYSDMLTAHDYISFLSDRFMTFNAIRERTGMSFNLLKHHLSNNRYYQYCIDIHGYKLYHISILEELKRIKRGRPEKFKPGKQLKNHLGL